MSEISDLSETDSSNTSVSGYSTDGSVANMSTTDNVFQSIMGMLKRWFKTSLFRLRDSTDQTKLLALDLSGITTGTTRTARMANHNATIGGYTTGSSIASATSLALGTDGDYFTVTGTTTITGISASGVSIGTRVLLEFADAVTLTHGASLVLPEGSSFTTAAGDRGVFVKTAVGNVWLCESFTRATAPAQALVSLSGLANTDITIPDWVNRVDLQFFNASPSETAAISVFMMDAGGAETTGYNGTVVTNGVAANLSTNFVVTPSVAAASAVYGRMSLRRISSTSWGGDSSIGLSNTSYSVEMKGGKTTSEATTGIRIAVSSGTFDTGSVRAFFSR
jgi:hypothetical protein